MLERFKNWMFRKLVRGYLHSRDDGYMIRMVLEEGLREYHEDNVSTVTGHFSAKLGLAESNILNERRLTKRIKHE